MTRAIAGAAVICLGLVGIASADEAPGAPGHTRKSTTIYLSTPWSPGPTVPVRIGAEGVVRAHRHGFAFEARLGGGVAASVVGVGGRYAANGGVSVGGALAVGRRVVIAPMAAYDLFVEWEQYGSHVMTHYFTVEIPISFVLDRGVVIEPFLQVGIARYLGELDPVVVVGPRIGIVL